MNRTLLVMIALVVVGAAAYILGSRNGGTGENALDHVLTGAGQKVDQWTSESEARMNAAEAERNFNAAASATTDGGMIGHAVEGLGHKIQQGANEAEAEFKRSQAEGHFSAAGDAVNPTQGR